MARFSYLTLHAEKEIFHEIVEWYSEFLDLETLWESDAFVMFGSEGENDFGIHIGPSVPDPEVIQLHFELDDVDRSYAELSSRGLVFEEMPKNTGWGLRVARTCDPVGHTVEIVSSLD